MIFPVVSDHELGCVRSLEKRSIFPTHKERRPSEGEISIARTIDHDLIWCTDMGFTSAGNGMTRKHEGLCIPCSIRCIGTLTSALRSNTAIHDHRSTITMRGLRRRATKTPIFPRGEVRRENQSGPIDGQSLFSHLGTGQRWKRRGPIMGPYRVGHNDQCRHAEILSGSSRDTGRVVELGPAE